VSSAPSGCSTYPLPLSHLRRLSKTCSVSMPSLQPFRTEGVHTESVICVRARWLDRVLYGRPVALDCNWLALSPSPSIRVIGVISRHRRGVILRLVCVVRLCDSVCPASY
jgi:hypothetical protein